MARVLETVVYTLFSVFLVWTVYRQLGVYLVRGRVVVATGRVLGIIIFGIFWVASFLLPLSVGIFALLAALVAAVALDRAGTWLVAGASSDRILDRAGLVLRGMGFSYREERGRGLEEAGGRIRLRVAASPTARTHVLRLRTARGINKVALFRANFRKFLLAIPRERR